MKQTATNRGKQMNEAKEEVIAKKATSLKSKVKTAEKKATKKATNKATKKAQ